jgi:hypothetical protein
MTHLFAAWSIEEWKNISDIGSNVVTALALAIGGTWAYWAFLRERTRWPRANVELVFAERPLDGWTLLLNIGVKVKNEGRGRMDLSQLRVDVYKVLPYDEEMQSKVKCGNQYAGDDVDATWPFVDKREKDCSGGKAELEPGETDQFNFDFFIDPAIETVSVTPTSRM